MVVQISICGKRAFVASATQLITWLHVNEQGSSQYSLHPAYMDLTTLQLETWWLLLCTQHTLSICLVSTPAHHPEHTSAQEPQPSNPHSCSKHTNINNQQSK